MRFWKKNEIFFRMADPANKTFEDFERSTQGGGQSECPLGYGNEPKAQQVYNHFSFFHFGGRFELKTKISAT